MDFLEYMEKRNKRNELRNRFDLEINFHKVKEIKKQIIKMDEELSVIERDNPHFTDKYASIVRF